MPSSILLSRFELQERVYELAWEIEDHYGPKQEPFTMLIVMDGAMVFGAALMRAIKIPYQVASIKCKSYEGGSRGKHLKITQDGPLAASRILIIEDIIDTGRTMQALKRCIMMDSRDIKVVSLIERKDHDPVADWIGFKIAPGFIYGYGLDDERGLGRGLKDLWVRGVVTQSRLR